MAKSEAQKVVDGIKKQFGDSSFRLASDPSLRVERVLTQSIGLNLATEGGFPRGKIVFIAGNPATGKSSFIYNEIASYQRLLGLPCVLIDSEASSDEERLKTFGVDPSNLIVENPPTLEEGLDKALYLVRECELGILAVDSIAMMSPTRESESGKGKTKSLLDDDVAIKARIMNKFFRRLAASLNYACNQGRKPPTIILVQQWYVSKIGLYPERDFSGGAGQKYISHLTIDFRHPAKNDGGADLIERVEIDEDGIVHEEDIKVGVRVNFELIKSKISPDKRKGLFFILTQPSKDGLAPPGINKVDECIRYGVKYKVIEQNGNWLSYQDLKTNGRDSFELHLWQKPDLVEKIEHEIYVAAGILPESLLTSPEKEPKSGRKKRTSILDSSGTTEQPIEVVAVAGCDGDTTTELLV